MKNTIPVARLYRVIGEGETPVGDPILGNQLEWKLAYIAGEYVIDLANCEKVYIFNKDKWQWEKASEKIEGS